MSTVVVPYSIAVKRLKLLDAVRECVKAPRTHEEIICFTALQSELRNQGLSVIHRVDYVVFTLMEYGFKSDKVGERAFRLSVPHCENFSHLWDCTRTYYIWSGTHLAYGVWCRKIGGANIMSNPELYSQTQDTTCYLLSKFSFYYYRWLWPQYGPWLKQANAHLKANGL